MKNIRVDASSASYEIHIGSGALANLGEWAAGLVSPGKVAVLSDQNVWRLHGTALETSLRGAGFEVSLVLRPPGEEQKSLGALSEVYDQLVEAGLDRKSALIAFGGGVVGDLGGFAAATYLRGIPYLQVPTTLLAQVDSSVGGKTGLNHPRGKNLIGAFYQPKGVLIDPDVLSSLPKPDFVAGLAEVLKHGVIWDASFFDYLKSHREDILEMSSEALEHIVAVSCDIKAKVVSRDEKEQGLRAILNYGHTVGHALEATEGYGQFRHGEAVSIGMVAAAMISERLELAPAGLVQEHCTTFASFGLPVQCEVESPDGILSAMYRDKKTLRGKLRFVLANRIGEVEVREEVTDGMLRDVLTALGAPLAE